MPDIDALPSSTSANSTAPATDDSRRSSTSSSRPRPGRISPRTERPRPATNDATLGELHEQMEEEQEGQVVYILLGSRFQVKTTKAPARIDCYE